MDMVGSRGRRARVAAALVERIALDRRRAGGVVRRGADIRPGIRAEDHSAVERDPDLGALSAEVELLARVVLVSVVWYWWQGDILVVNGCKVMVTLVDDATRRICVRVRGGGLFLWADGAGAYVRRQ